MHSLGASWNSLTGDSYWTKREKEEREIYEKASFNCTGGKWIGFRARAAF
jgi:hypothetical protein